MKNRFRTFIFGYINKSETLKEFLKEVTVTDYDAQDKAALDVHLLNADDIAGNEEGETQAAGETISAVKVIYSNGTNVFTADANTDFQHASAVGVTLTAGGSGTEIRYLKDGIYYDSSLSFTDGEPVFLGLNGALTQLDPDSQGWMYRTLIGIATGSNGLNINIQEPIMN